MSTFSKQWIPLQKQLVPKAKLLGSAYQRNLLRRHREAIHTALTRGYLKLLDQKLILESQLDTEQTAELGDVLRISLNACSVQALDDIAVLSCVRLRICNLASCYVSDISAFYGSVNLLKLDVSNNQISHLPAADFWSSLSSLRVLYLNGNAVSEKESISKLNSCPELHVLALHETPLALTKSYRHHVVNSIFSLKALDYYVISDEEIVENLHLSGPFKPFSDNFKIQLCKIYPTGTSYKEELQDIYSMLLAVNTILAHYSPVMIIQRWARGWLTRRTLTKSNNSKIKAFMNRRALCAQKQLGPLRRSNKSHSEAGRKTISAEVPIIHPSHDTRQTSNPPPPTPTLLTPRRGKLMGIETHIIGIDGESSRLKYTMHINLRKLHQNVVEAEETVDNGNSKTFRSVFQRKPLKGIKTSDDKGHRKKVKLPEVEKKSPSKPTIPEQEHTSNKEEYQNDLQLNEKHSKEDTAIHLSGQTAQVLPHDALPDLETTRKDTGRMIREAEKEINRARTEMKRPPQKQAKSTTFSKDDFFLTRTSGTMTLSDLTAAEKVHNARKKNNELMRKANLVARIRHERVLRQSKIEEFWGTLKDNNREWKDAEDHKLLQMKQKLENKRKSELLERSKVCNVMATTMQAQTKDQEFASKFNQHNTMVVNTLSKEDRRVSKDITFSETKERVQEARTLSLEQQELVKEYMELRKTRLLQEGITAKNELDTKMVEAISHRLIEAKRKVAKEVARKQAARTAIAIAKEEMRKGPHHPGESIPALSGPPVKLDINSGAAQTHTDTATISTQTPPHVKRLNRQAHKTWQRGSETLRESEGHFPMLPLGEESPMMYNMMHPGRMCTSSGINTPFSELECTCTCSSSPGDAISTNSLLIRCQKVN